VEEALQWVKYNVGKTIRKEKAAKKRTQTKRPVRYNPRKSMLTSKAHPRTYLISEALAELKYWAETAQEQLKRVKKSIW